MSAAVSTLIGHPHVQRTVAHEGEAALGLVQLHRGHADVEHRAVQPGLPLSAKASARPEKGVRTRRNWPGKSLATASAWGWTVGSRSRAMTLGAGRQDGAGIAAGAEGGVDHRLAGLRATGPRSAQVIRQRNATSCIKRQLGHAAQHAGFQRGADRIAELQLLDHAQVTVKQGFSATFQAIGLDRGEAEHAVEGARDGGAEVLRHNDAPLAVHLLLERREEHALPLPKDPCRAAKSECARRNWVNMG
jgi:hypothetical protein